MGGSPAHQKHMLANLAASLFEHGKITTTEARARRLRPYAEKLITFAKRGDLHARRQVLTVVPDKGIVHSLFTEIGPGFADRDGGYTRITKLGPRKGDAAPMAVIELVKDEVTAARPRRRARRAGAPAAEAVAVEEAAEAEAEALEAEAEADEEAFDEEAFDEEAGDEEAVDEEAGDEEAVEDTAGADDAGSDEAGADEPAEVAAEAEAGTGQDAAAEDDTKA